MPPLLISLLSWLSFPAYVVQGIQVRRRSLRLSPAPGPRSGKEGSGNPATMLLTIGDSSAAAVGVEHTSQAIGPHIARKLHDRNGETVAWHISGHNSATAGQIRDHVVPNLQRWEFTHIVIMLGTNDIKNWHSTGRWKRDFGTLLYALRTRFPEARIYWHQAIDMHQVPALPRLLATILNWRAMLINRKGEQLCRERGAICVPPLQNVEPSGFCADGFHASGTGYDAWANHLLEHWER